jgi:hypothetical protein
LVSEECSFAVAGVSTSGRSDDDDSAFDAILR